MSKAMEEIIMTNEEKTEKMQTLIEETKELSDEELALVAGGTEFRLPDGGVLEICDYASGSGPGCIKVVNATGLLEVCSIFGNVVLSVTATGGEQRFMLPKGIYIVKHKKIACKVIVR
jgi:hypothetical protein